MTDIEEVCELLVMEGITKSFPGVKALDNAQLTLRRGSVHALMGENGAGKSTLMKCLFGVYRADGGSIRLSGEEVRFSSAREALDGGVAMVHQELSQAMRRSVMDNMFLGRYPRISPRLPFTSEKRLYDMTREVFEELGIDIDPRERMENLSVSKRQMIEIAKAVSYKAQVLNSQLQLPLLSTPSRVTTTWLLLLRLKSSQVATAQVVFRDNLNKTLKGTREGSLF